MEYVLKYLTALLLVANSLCSLLHVNGSSDTSRISDLSATIDSRDVEEGGNVTVVCNVTATGRVHWTSDVGYFSDGRTLSIKNITRNLAGFYTCFAYNTTYTDATGEPNLQETVYTFLLNVLYPAKILSVNITSTKVPLHDDFRMRVKVEGNPSPTTTFMSLNDGRTWFLQNKSEGTFNISIPSVNCTDTGQYLLRCENDLANDSVTEYITVLCPPKLDPNFPLNKTIKPRVGDSVGIIVHVISVSKPTYQWWHNGTQLINHTDTRNTTELDLNELAAEDFGQYKLLVINDVGNISIQFDIKAEGPPDPVTDLEVSGVTTNTVNLSFVTGFDYNDRQNFYILRELDGNLTDFKRKVMDSPGDSGGRKITLVIVNLTESTGYSLTVMSGNSHGNSTHIPNALPFSTYGKPGPDPRFPLNTTYSPRLGNSVTLTMHARGNPVPEYYWSHNGTHVNSTDDKYNSTVVIPEVSVNNFGTYALNITNSAGIYSLEYKVLADGPPEPVSNLGVFGINETCAHLNFTTGFNYNRTQTFIINMYKDGKMTVLKNCTDLTSGRGGDPFTCMVCKLEEDTIYNVTVISKNSRGESPPEPVTFSTYGAPKPDPARTTNSTFKPRLGKAVALTMHAVGNPVPKYQWFHNGIPVNSTDTDCTSEVRIENVVVEDFGKYVLNMTNEAGHFTRVYEILADGPPAPVTNLNLSAVTTSSANLSFITGYDYNKTQTFVVVRFRNGKMTELENVTDNFPDPGKKEFNIGVMTLASDAVYNVTVLSRNSNGISLPSSSEFITFTTEGGPGPDPDHLINNTVSPRLGTDASFIVHAVGNPQPVFSWSHNNLPISHTDHGLTTTIQIQKVTVEDFGEYVLNMENKFGSWNNSYLLKEDGPPDAVNNLRFIDITSDSVVLSWDAGFNYGSKQSFDVKGTVNDKEYSNLDPIPDKTGGKGGAESFMLNNLESSASYNIYLVAKNQRGTAKMSNEISFATKDGPGKSKTPAAEIVGYVIGAIGGVVLIIVIITVIRRYRRRKGDIRYEEIHEERDEDAQPQPHRYRYDDAAAPSPGL